ncbi:nucleoside hydrolase [Leifsonia shinshuensis]|uniref:Purine nucleosidase n=1 Tax=Leifsonia shinshuensis TaxID=150026 RepID=A0A853CPW8_9MICO|nr:purine nucleosidase [Leifsonia shinshuensis]
MPQPLVLDTDIGTDVDDILALSMIVGSPELDLTGVTTVYGDVRLRARMIARTLAVAGALRPVIVPGLGLTRSGRPVWWPGHEGRLMPDLEIEVIDDDLDAITVLASASTVAAIGPLTNIAAMTERPDRAVDHIVMMGGEFRLGRPEHNIVCDVDAADVVFRSGVLLTAVGLDQTERVRITERSLEAIETAGPLGDLLYSEVRQFWSFAEQDYNVPHDPVAVLAIARPDLFTTERGQITVATSGPDAGVTTFVPDPAGPHRVVTDVDTEQVASEIVSRIVAAGVRNLAPLEEEKQ